MNKDELSKLKEKLGTLTEKEEKLRNIYLRKLATGELQGPPVGYASVDKPWLKYFSEESIMKDFDDMSIYQLMESKNLGHESEIALSYFGKKTTYGELLKNIDKTAKALLELGIKKGDIVMMSLPNIPEAEYIFYGLNKIGAVIDSIDPRTNKENIQDDMKKTNAKYFFALDMIYPKIKDIAKKENIQIISVSPTLSLPAPIKMLASLKNKKQKLESNDISYEDFIKLSKQHKEAIIPVYEKGTMAVIVHTGGSTGVPKGVLLSNEGFNSLIYQQMYSNMGFERNKKFLNLLPPFIALGLNNAMHLSACLGLESILIPSFEPEDFPKLIMKHKPNIVLGGPIHFNMLINSELVKDKDLSFLEICCSGGDKMPRETQENIQRFLKEHNAKANIWLGYGATETSAGTTCVKNDCFRYESVGAPYLKNVLEVYDTDTGEMIRGYGKIGELRVKAPTMMIGYFDKESTDSVIHTDEYGNRWYKTGDLAHFDNDGMVYIDGRIKRIITRRGFKIYPAYVEELIMEHPYIKECAVVGVQDPEELNIPVANIVLKDGYNSKENEDEVVEYIDKKIRETLPEYTVMAGYNFLEELPKTPIGKLDFIKLEKMGIIGNKSKKLQKKFEMK